jgi:hypothetical protein
MFELDAFGGGDGRYLGSKKAEKVAVRPDSPYISLFSEEMAWRIHRIYIAIILNHY